MTEQRTSPRRRQKGSLEKACDSLDWPWLLERLVEHAGSSLGQRRVRDLSFATTLTEATRLQEETSEVRALIDDNRTPPIGGLQDVRDRLAAVAKEEILTARDFADIAETLGAFDRLRKFFAQNTEDAPRTADVASRLPDLGHLGQDLRESFDAQGELSVTRYPELARMRQRLYSVHNRVRDHLSRILESPDMEAMLQDNYYTVRSDRYVIPIKVQHKNVAEGIIHDASGSGQTVFVEPASVIPLNNELKLAEGELKREERRILIGISESVARKAAQIRDGLEVAAELEFILARARMSQQLSATEPRLNHKGRVHLLGARHPVLNLRGIDVIPNDITVGEGHQAIVISGPNTGGKTVALKTLGLCALMARAGLHVPAEGGSEVALFGRIFTDIGDTQTIEGDLSTFSGHITAIRDIVEGVDKAVAADYQAGIHTLVLLDEIAVGTDPTQGAALAQGILMSLVDRGCRVVVTTHYADLKTLSTRDPRFTSARVDYDGLRPTYRLKYGLPGRSFALDIARQLGLHREIIERSEALLSPETLKVDELVGNLERQLTEARQDREKAKSELRDAETLRGRYERRLASMEAEVDRLRREKLGAFEREVAKAKDEIKGIVRELQAGPTTQKIGAARERVRLVTHKVKEKVPKAPEAPRDMLGQPMNWAEAKVGDRVMLTKLKKTGELTSVPPSGPVEVTVGGMKVKVARKDVLKAHASQETPRRPAKKARRAWSDVAAEAPSADRLTMPGEEGDDGDAVLDHAMQLSTNTVDLRGERVEAGLDKMDQFLDAAAMRGERAVIVIHGHGTGAMRDAVREHLRASPYVDRFQAGGRRQGGNGVTVVGVK